MLMPLPLPLLLLPLACAYTWSAVYHLPPQNALRDPLDPKQGTVQPVKGKPATVITEAGAKQQQQDDDTKPEGLDEKLRGMFGLGELHKRFEESILGPHNAAKAAAGAAKVGVGKLLQFAGDVLRGDLLDDMKVGCCWLSTLGSNSCACTTVVPAAWVCFGHRDCRRQHMSVMDAVRWMSTGSC